MGRAKLFHIKDINATEEKPPQLLQNDSPLPRENAFTPQTPQRTLMKRNGACARLKLSATVIRTRGRQKDPTQNIPRRNLDPSQNPRTVIVRKMPLLKGQRMRRRLSVRDGRDVWSDRNASEKRAAAAVPTVMPLKAKRRKSPLPLRSPLLAQVPRTVPREKATRGQGSAKRVPSATLDNAGGMHLRQTLTRNPRVEHVSRPETVANGR